MGGTPPPPAPVPYFQIIVKVVHITYDYLFGRIAYVFRKRLMSLTSIS